MPFCPVYMSSPIRIHYLACLALVYLHCFLVILIWHHNQAAAQRWPYLIALWPLTRAVCIMTCGCVWSQHFDWGFIWLLSPLKQQTQFDKNCVTGKVDTQEKMTRIHVANLCTPPVHQHDYVWTPFSYTQQCKHKLFSVTKWCVYVLWEMQRKPKARKKEKKQWP